MASKTDAKILNCFSLFSSLESWKGPSEDSLSQSHMVPAGSGGAVWLPQSPSWPLALVASSGVPAGMTWRLCNSLGLTLLFLGPPFLHVTSRCVSAWSRNSVRGNQTCWLQTVTDTDNVWGFWPALALLYCCGILLDKSSSQGESRFRKRSW